MAVDLSKVDEDALLDRLEKCGLGFEGEISDRVKRLEQWCREHVKASEIVDCETCGGSSSVRWKRCPYCGDEDLSEAAAEVRDKIGKEDPAMGTKSKKKASTKKKKTAAKKPKPKPKAKKASTKKKATRKRSTAKKKTTAAKKEAAPTTQVLSGNEKDLDDAIERLGKLKKEAAGIEWNFCAEMKRIFDKKLYLARTDKEGKTKYKHWNQFVSLELGITPGYSYQLMDIARHFTASQLADVGTKKLIMMLKLPKPERSKLLPKASETPASEIRERVREFAGEGTRDTGRSGRAAAATEAANEGRKAKKDQITIVVESERQRIKLFARPKGSEEPQPAKKLTDEPYAIEETINGIEIHYRLVQDSTGGLVLVVERRRKNG